MKLLLAISSIILLSASGKSCKQQQELPEGCYKGKLVIKAACMNYTISVTGGTMDTSRIESSWTDETTSKTYKNVFALGSRCNFPPDIKEGDEFYFNIDSTTAMNCAVCLIYYPVPQRHLSIKLLSQPCNQQ